MVQGHSDKVLPCSTFTRNQHGEVRPSVFTNPFHHTEKGPALTDDLNLSTNVFKRLLEFEISFQLFGVGQGVAQGDGPYIHYGLEELKEF